MNVRVDPEDIQARLARLEGRVEPMVLEARKTGLDVEEKQKAVLSDLETRLPDVRARLKEAKQASGERAAPARRDRGEAWEALETHFDRIARGPAD